jgi:hypothetical protein
VRWREWSDDELGRCFACAPYAIREYGAVDGVMQWRLDGDGLCEYGADPELLKISAEQHQKQRQRVAVAAGSPPPPPRASAEEVERYAGELRDLQRTVRFLGKVVGGVDPYEFRAVAASRAALEDARDQLSRIIERLP